MYPRPGNLVAIGHAVMHYARAAYIFSAGIKCQHCIWQKCPLKKRHSQWVFELYMSKITIFGPANYLGLMHHGHNARH